MFLDPDVDVDVKQVVTFRSELKPLWLKALAREEAELQRLAADAIARAHELGLGDFRDCSDALLDALNRPGLEEMSRRAIARALVVVEAKDAASALARFAGTGHMQVAEVVEPALARWGYGPIKHEWLRRLQDPSEPRVSVLLAIDGLTTMRDGQALWPMMAIVEDRHRPASLRLAAARGAAQLKADDIVERARQLADEAPQHSDPLVERLLAVALLQQQSSGEAITLLTRLAQESNPVVAAGAFQRLREIDPKLTFDLAPQAIASSDARLRRLGAESLVDQGGTVMVENLAPLLDDVNPGIRRLVAYAFYEAASDDELAELIIDKAMDMLSSGSWRGLEQSILVLGYLDHKPMADRLIELLKHERTEVNVTAAWGLRVLKLPETLPAMLEQAQWQRERCTSFEDLQTVERVSLQVSQLFQAFGIMKYREADSLMRGYVPQNDFYGTPARAAACWSLGWLYEDQPDRALARQLEQRLSDLDDQNPEEPEVRWTCAVALGRMKSEASLPVLRNFADYDGPNSPIGRSCYWAIERMTGEPIPPPETETIGSRGWFLEPSPSD